MIGLWLTQSNYCIYDSFWFPSNSSSFFLIYMFSIFHGVDLWTTRCTRCPAALDTLNEFAAGVTDPDDIATSMQCVSICCGDTLDGAREIIEATKLPRWSAIQHFFMAYNDKERFKQLLQFRQVPFYIVFDRNGTLLYSGNQKMDWSALFQEPSNHSTSVKQLLGIHSKSITVTEVSVHSPTSSLTIPTSQIVQPQQNSPQQNHEEDVPSLVIDDMDF